MRVNEFCEKYGLDLDVVKSRMNANYWEDFDSLVVPTEFGQVTPKQIKSILKLLKMGWTEREIVSKVGLKPNEVHVIQFASEMDDYRKNMFLNMESMFFLNPKKIDLKKNFYPVDGYTKTENVEKQLEGVL